MRLISILFLVLSINATAGHGQDGVSTREKRREIITLEQLKTFLEAPKRVIDMQPARVIDVLGVKPGESVADIGAGTGFFSFRLAGRVGPEGKIYAVEIEDELLDFMRRKMDSQHVENIILIKSSESAPNLPAACCDAILIINTYIYFDQPEVFLASLRPALRPGGRVAIIEVEAERADSVGKPLLRTEGRSAGQVIAEMKSAGFVLRETHDFLKSRFFLVFKAEE